jgi:hypothetical protein
MLGGNAGRPRRSDHSVTLEVEHWHGPSYAHNIRLLADERAEKLFADKGMTVRV